jgi:hypothetical protein
MARLAKCAGWNTMSLGNVVNERKRLLSPIVRQNSCTFTPMKSSMRSLGLTCCTSWQIRAAAFRFLID